MTHRDDIPLEDVVKAALDGALLDLHTSMPGIVRSYDPEAGTCDVQPAVKRVLETLDGKAVFEALPVIPNVRVCWPGAGDFELRFPLAKGDTVLLVFSEADANPFEVTGQVSPPAWLARHSLNSVVAYPYRRLPPPSLAPKEVQALPQLVAPEPFHVGDPQTAQFVAVEEKLKAALASAADAAATAAVPNDGGKVAFQTFKATVLGWSSGTIGSNKLKAEAGP